MKNINDSPTSRRIHGLSEKELNKLFSEFAGREHNWTKDLSAVFEIVEKHNMLRHPRYFSKTVNGDRWAVRECYTKCPLSIGDTLPIAVIRAVMILVEGKGQYFSEHQPQCDVKSSSTSTASSRTSRPATARSTTSQTRSKQTPRSGVTKRGTASRRRG